MTDDKTKRILLFCVGAILLIVIVWSILLSRGGEQAHLCEQINAFGYHVIPEDLYVSDVSGEKVSIREALAGMDLSEVIDVSRQAGFSCDVDTVGQVVLVMVPIGEDQVITLYLLDEEIALGFVQQQNTGIVEKLGVTP